jgi:hypothetical protein
LSSPEARVYIDSVLKKNEQPITQDFFNEQENNLFKKEILSTLVNNADIHDFNAYKKDREIQNYKNFSSLPINYYGSPMRSVFGNSRLRIPKNAKYEDAEIEIFDKYDFGGEFAGKGYISNLKKIFDGIKNKNTQDVMLGIEYFAERYGRGIYPEDEIAKKLGVEPNFVPVSLKYPVSDLMTKEQWEAYSKKYFDQFEGNTEGYSYDWGILQDPYVKDGKRVDFRYTEEGKKAVEGMGNVAKFSEYLSGSDDPFVGINISSLEPDVIVEKKAGGGGININDLPKVNSIPDVGSITPISPFEMNETFGGPLYQMLNPGAQQMVDRLGLRGQGLSGIMAETFGPGGKIKLSKAALAKIKPLLKERKVQRRFEESTDPNERLGAQTKIKQIEKKIDKIIADDQS